MMIAISSLRWDVVATAGPVIDVEFTDESLPPIDEALLVQIEQDRWLFLEKAYPSASGGPECGDGVRWTV